MKSSLFVRFLVAAGIIILFIFSLVEWGLFDGLLTNFWPAAAIICIGLGILCAGITKGAIVNRKIIAATRESFNDKTNRKYIMDYWIWAGIWCVFFLVWMFIHKGEI